ncbi:MAG: type II toxin-antitoxin system HicB family antitoxin [Planctomycetota bacterium]
MKSKEGKSKVVGVIVGTKGRVQHFGVELSLETDDDGSSYYLARSIEIPGCMSDGSSIEEALMNLGDAIQLCLTTSESATSKRAPIDKGYGSDLFVKGASLQLFQTKSSSSPASAVSGPIAESNLYPLPTRRGALANAK